MFSHRFLIIQAFIVAAAMALAFWYVHQRNAAPLPVYSALADFSLTDQEGGAITLGSLKGKVWVADFMFTSCPSICPVLSKSMAGLYEIYAKDDGIRFVSVTVDPETDTPAVLKAYAQKYKATNGHWLFLTGPHDAIQQMAVKSFKIGNINQIIMHSPSFTLVDRQGRIRGYYDGTDTEAMQRLPADVGALRKE